MTEKNFSVFASGTFGDWAKAELKLPDGRSVLGKRFLKDIIGSTGCEISLNALPAGKSVPFFHAHKENEEVYIFLGGEGEMQVDGEIVPVREGSVVRIAPDGLRCMRNTGGEDLLSIVIQVREGSLRQRNREDGIIPEAPVSWVA